LQQISKGQMFFLAFNQQCQSIEGNIKLCSIQQSVLILSSSTTGL